MLCGKFEGRGHVGSLGDLDVEGWHATLIAYGVLRRHAGWGYSVVDETLVLRLGEARLTLQIHESAMEIRPQRPLLPIISNRRTSCVVDVIEHTSELGKARQSDRGGNPQSTPNGSVEGFP